MSASLSASAIPGLLIVQSKVVHKNSKDKSDPNVEVAALIGQEYDTNGRVTPVVYSKSDPIFSSAVATGRLKDAPANPRIGEALDIARKLGAEYTLILEAARVGNFVKAKVHLYRDHREIWKEDENLSVATTDNFNTNDTARSLARTLVLKLNAGPFKGFPEHPKTATPGLERGQTPITGATTPTIRPEVTNAQLKKNIDSLVQSNRRESAVLLMRDAVDAAPFDVERRTMLIDLILSTSPADAAIEARKAAALMPEKVEFRVIAARAWMKAGRADEAKKDLNEAVARDPNAASTRLLLGELSLGQLEPTKALAHLDEVIKQKDSGQARFLRALCRALLGGADGMQLDLTQLDKLEPAKLGPDVSRRYALAADITDRALAQDGSDLRSLLTKVVVKPKDQGIHDQIEQTLRVMQTRSQLLQTISVPIDAKSSNDRRVLAHKLVIQCLSELSSYCNTPDDGTLDDARTNLGEALKHLAAAKGQ